MKKLTNDQLYLNARRKGILFSRGEKKEFEKYDYFQVINAYKALFVVGVESIDDIEKIIDSNNTNEIIRIQKYFDISTYNSTNDLKTKICLKIGKKYGLNFDKNSSLIDMKNEINRIRYIHHIYGPDALYKDFVRMYKFEHQLRSLLLKYVLIIEENIKRVFISTLNDASVYTNYLVDINSYNNSSGNNKALLSLNKVIQLYTNDNSKPISRKKDQGLVVPYWIIINEMTLGQTINTIKNLDNRIRLSVFQRCVNEFTYKQIDIFKPNIGEGDYNNAIDDINKMIDVLTYIGDFRNLLAHNQPIYSFNVENSDMCKYPDITYSKPNVTMKKNHSYNQNQIEGALLSKNLKYLAKFQEFFGPDFFNCRKKKVNLDLSWIIYVVSKIVTCLKPENPFTAEIKSLYKRYNIVSLSFDKKLENLSAVENLKSTVANLTVEQKIDNLKSIVANSNSGSISNKMLIKELNMIKNDINKIVKTTNKIKIVREKSEYDLFSRTLEYQKYTNITSNFLNSL